MLQAREREHPIETGERPFVLGELVVAHATQRKADLSRDQNAPAQASRNDQVARGK